MGSRGVGGGSDCDEMREQWESGGKYLREEQRAVGNGREDGSSGVGGDSACEGSREQWGSVERMRGREVGRDSPCGRTREQWEKVERMRVQE